LRALVEDPPRVLAPLLLLRSVCGAATGALLTVLFAHFVGDGFAAVGLTLALLGPVAFVLIDVVPRVLARRRPLGVALRTAWLVRAVSSLSGPLARVLVALADRLLPGHSIGDGPFSTEAELRDLVEQAERSGVVEQRQADMLSGVFELGETLAREVMVPRPDIIFIERDKTVRQALTVALRSGFSRLPVMGESRDDVVGVVFLKDLARKAIDARSPARPVPLMDVVREVTFVPDSKAVDELLREMQARRTHLVVVVDEYGGTAGIVTIEDILEEIVGEITDEYDNETAPVVELESGALRVTARLLVEEVEHRCGVDLPHDEGVETVSGLMANALGRVPIPGSRVEIGGLWFTAEAAAGRRHRVGTVLLERADAAQVVVAGQPGASADENERESL
jgi:CBS domain containing-hemolysin-like protein